MLAPGKGWEASIDRHGRSWVSPWGVQNDVESGFVVVWNGNLNVTAEAPGYQQSRNMLSQFATSRGLLRQSSMALMAALSIPTHNVWMTPVSLPVPHAMHRSSHDTVTDTTAFQRLVELLPRLVTVGLFGLESIILSAVFDESIHSLASGQWIEPCIMSWPASSALAAEVGYQRTPQLAKWWIGMGISGMLSRRFVKLLAETGMWSTNLVFYLWTGAKHSYVCKVLEEDTSVSVMGRGAWATVLRAEELLMLFLTSGDGPEGRLIDPPRCPWRMPGTILLEKSDVKVIQYAQLGARIRLFYEGWCWGEGQKDTAAPISSISPSPIDKMPDNSAAATRAALGWLDNPRGPEADCIIELEALRQQIQIVEEDQQVGGSDYFGDSGSNTSYSLNQTVSLALLGENRFNDAEVLRPWDGDIGDAVKSMDLVSTERFGWCGLDAINVGLSLLGLSEITREEACDILSTTEDEIRDGGMSVNQLELLLNTRERSVAVVDVRSHERFRLNAAKYKDSTIDVGIDFAPHFIALKK